MKLRAAPFASLLQREAGFALALARLEASRLRDLNQRFALQSADATTHLLDTLAYLARKTGPYFGLSMSSHHWLRRKSLSSQVWPA